MSKNQFLPVKNFNQNLLKIKMVRILGVTYIRKIMLFFYSYSLYWLYDLTSNIKRK